MDFFETARGEVVKTFKEEGTVTAVEERDVYAILPNKIVSLKVKEGQEIAKGQKIASLDLEQPDEHWERYLYFNAGWFFGADPALFAQRFLKVFKIVGKHVASYDLIGLEAGA